MKSLVRRVKARVLTFFFSSFFVGYVRGDRFSPEFVEKRRASLERFLKKIAVHPVLQRSESLRVFLDSRDWNSDLAQQNKKRQDDGRLDAIGDVLLNAFAKIKKPDERFVAMREEVEKLEENLQGLEKLEQRILKRQEGRKSCIPPLVTQRSYYMTLL